MIAKLRVQINVRGTKNEIGIVETRIASLLSEIVGVTSFHIEVVDLE